MRVRFMDVLIINSFRATGFLFSVLPLHTLQISESADVFCMIMFYHGSEVLSCKMVANNDTILSYLGEGRMIPGKGRNLFFLILLIK